jgi:hypothetical protein
MWAVDIRAFLPEQAEPSKVLERGDGELGPATVGVQVFGPVDQLALRGLRAGGGQREGAGVSEVQVPGGRGGESSAVHDGRTRQAYSGLPVATNSQGTPNSAETAAAKAFTPQVSVA